MTFEEFKAKVKKNAPAIITVATAVIGSAGWIVAGIYAKKVEELETVDPNAWPTIKVSPETMDAILGGATLKYRKMQTSPRGWIEQYTTGEFRGAVDESWEKARKTKEEFESDN